MNLLEIDETVERFKRFGNDAFAPMLAHYKPVFVNCYHHLLKYMRLDREEFYVDFQRLLFNSLRKFDATVEGKSDTSVISRFDRYFAAAVRKMVMGLKRSCMTLRKQNEKFTISLSDGKIDLPDEKVESTIEMMEILDVIESLEDPLDRELLLMRLDGCTRQDVCDLLNIPLHTYRARLARVQLSPSIVSLTSNL